MQRQTCSQWSATDSENHSVSTDLFAISSSPNSFFFYFCGKTLSITVRTWKDKNSTSRWAVCSCSVLDCSNKPGFLLPFPLVLVWKLNWDQDLFGFIISAGNELPRDHGDVGRICSSSLEIIGKKVVFFVKQCAYNLCFYCTRYLWKTSLALFAPTCCIHSSATWHTKKIWKHSICLIKTA